MTTYAFAHRFDPTYKVAAWCKRRDGDTYEVINGRWDFEVIGRKSKDDKFFGDALVVRVNKTRAIAELVMVWQGDVPDYVSVVGSDWTSAINWIQRRVDTVTGLAENLPAQGPAPVPTLEEQGYRRVNLTVMTRWPIDRITGVLVSDAKGNASKAELITADLVERREGNR